MHSDTYSTVPNAPPGPRADGSEPLADAASNLKSRAAQPQRSAGENLDANRGEAADRLASGGTSLHAKAESLSGRPRVARAAHAAANTLTHTAEYIRKHDAASMMADAKRVIKENPGYAMLGAAVIGFALGRLWSRD